MQAILKKLHYRDQSPVLILNAPAEADTLVQAFGDVQTAPKGKAAFVLAYAQNQSTAAKSAKIVTKSLEPGGVFWMAYPKGSSKKYKSDINRDRLHAVMHEQGFDGVSLVSLDGDWSAMRFKLL